MTETDKPVPASWREAFAQLKEQLQRMSEPRPLVFEPAHDAGAGGQIPTPEGMVDLLPRRGYDDDAGLDLMVSADVKIGPNQFVDIPTGVKCDIPHGHWLFIVGRSSTLRKRGLLVNPGVIDAGWTGELFAGVQNITDQTVEVRAGERLSQAILLAAPVTGYRPVWGKVPNKARGTNGFGSTGS